MATALTLASKKQLSISVTTPILGAKNLSLELTNKERNKMIDQDQRKAIWAELTYGGYVSTVLHKLAIGNVGWGTDIVKFLDTYMTDCLFHPAGCCDWLEVGVRCMHEAVIAANEMVDRKTTFIMNVTRRRELMSFHQRELSRKRAMHEVRDVYAQVDELFFGSAKDLVDVNATFNTPHGLVVTQVSELVDGLPVEIIEKVSSRTAFELSMSLPYAVRHHAEFHKQKTILITDSVAQQMFECRHPQAVTDVTGYRRDRTAYLEAVGGM
jgi:hypothetical protein